MRRVALLTLVVPAIVVVAEYRLSDGEPHGPADPIPALWEDASHDAESPAAANCPFVLSPDLGDPFRFTPPHRGVSFDIDADGDLDRVAWTSRGSQVAFLALDRNGDGSIATGSELIGRFAHSAAANAPTALAALASDALLGARRGKIDGRNPLFGDLLLWTDTDHDGISRPSELRPAQELVSAIGLGYTRQHRRDPYGNESRYRGFVHIRTAPGLNETVSAADDLRRIRPLYDVCLVTG